MLTISYADGIRTCKQVVTAQYGDTEETRQYVEGDRVIYEEDVFYKGPEGPSTAVIQNKRYYMYDQTGIVGMKINNTSYIFEKNVLGDVVAIYDELGYLKAKYTYDAWGNFEIEQDSDKIGDLNPFRYRGYYYDTETGFYYLQSRYYDPEIRRFINADNLELIPELARVPGQLNLYAYCNNNPIMYTDPNGEGILLSLIIGVIISGAVIYGTVSGVNAYNDGARGWDLAGSIISGGVVGGLTGGFIGLSLGAGFGLAGLGGGAFAIAGGGVEALVAAGAIVAGGALAVSGSAAALNWGSNILYSKNADRYGNSKIGSNQYYNKQFDAFWKEFGDGSLKTRRRFHDYITKKGYDTWEQLIRAWRSFIK